MRRTRVLGRALVGVLAVSAVSEAGLSGSSVTGSLRFIGSTNFFDPTFNRVPAGYGNSSSAVNVSVVDPGIEFGFQDEFGRITADFTTLRLTLTETAIAGTDAVTERFNFTDTAFAGLVPVQVSNSYPVTPTFSIVDAGLSILIPSGYATVTGNSMSFTLALTLPGDADLNGAVDFNDFLALQNNFGNANTSFVQGNFNADGQTDFDDFLVLQNNFGQAADHSAVAVTDAQVAALTAFAATNVPEPTLLCVAGLGALGLLRRQSRRKRRPQP